MTLKHGAAELLAALLALGVWLCALATLAMWTLIRAYGASVDGSSWFPAPDWMEVWGSLTPLLSAPIMLAAILASVYLAVIRHLQPKSRWRSSGAWISDSFSRVVVASTWTNGVITPGFILGYAVLLLPALIIIIGVCVRSSTIEVNQEHYSFIPSEACRFIYFVGKILGSGAFFASTILLLPVCRTSSLLRMCGISYECGVSYHRILGYWTVGLTLFHGGLIYIGWIDSGNFWVQFSQWKSDDFSHLAGSLAGMCALAILVTAVPWMRRRFFETFLYTHMLYVLFFVFVAFHLAAWAYPYTIGALCLFMLDWSIRTIQAWNTVVPSSVKCLPDGCISLTIPLAPGAQYKALDVVYIKVPSISMLQWHPFSISSSPAQNSQEATIIVKPLGAWTKSLYHLAEQHSEAHHASSMARCPRNDTTSSSSSQEGDASLSFRTVSDVSTSMMSRRASNTSAASDANSMCPQSSHTSKSKGAAPLRLQVEGPYGLEHDFLERYDSLLLIAGGVGITPILSLLSELASRMKQEHQESRVPSNVVLVWCIREASSLAMLGQAGVDVAALTMPHTCEGQGSGSKKACRVHLRVVVTGEGDKELGLESAHHLGQAIYQDNSNSAGCRKDVDEGEMLKPHIGAGGRDLFTAWATVLFCTVMLGTVMLCLRYITNKTMMTGNELMHSAFNTAWATLFMTIAIALGAALGTAMVYMVWIVLLYVAPRTAMQRSSTTSGLEKEAQEKEVALAQSLGDHGLHVVSGERPDFEAEFEFMASLKTRVGVILSGPVGLEIAVGKQIQKHSRMFGRPSCTLHSLSFNM